MGKTVKNENFSPSVFSDILDHAKFFGKNWIEKEFGQSFPAVNIKETSKQYDLEFAAPGFRKEDFKIDVEDAVLTVHAEKKEEKNDSNGKYARREFSFQSFSRSFSLPENVSVEKIDAKYSDGILMLSVPKKVETKSSPKKKIVVG